MTFNKMENIEQIMQAFSCSKYLGGTKWIPAYWTLDLTVWVILPYIAMRCFDQFRGDAGYQVDIVQILKLFIVQCINQHISMYPQNSLKWKTRCWCPWAKSVLQFVPVLLLFFMTHILLVTTFSHFSGSYANGYTWFILKINWGKGNFIPKHLIPYTLCFVAYCI